MRRFGLVLALVVLVAAGCSDDNKKTSETSGPKTAKVQVDAKAPFPATFTAYFPNEVRVHPGDTVSFTSVYTGEPHSVSFGTLVNQGIAAAEPHKDDPNFDASSVPQLAAIPPMLPEGPGDANQVSAQPCFVTSGNPPGPGETPCPNHSATPPEFTGTESFFSSGWLPDGAVFNVKLANNIQPGTYTYFCTLHTTQQVGKVTVVPSADKVPSTDDDKKAADEQIQQRVSALQPAVDASKNATAQKAVAGVASEEAHDALANVFGPPEISVPVGAPVDWTIFGPHTISFGAPADAIGILNKAPDGAVHVNPKTGAPTGGGVPQPQPGGGGPQAGGGGGGSTSTTAASATTTTGGSSTTAAGGGGPGGNIPPPARVDGGTYGGSGFYSSGLYLSFPGNLFDYSIRFTKAGTYQYVCLVHPGMTGSVKVG